MIRFYFLKGKERIINFFTTKGIVMKRWCIVCFLYWALGAGCGKKTSDSNVPPPAANFTLQSWSLNGTSSQPVPATSLSPQVRFQFSAPVNRSAVQNSISLTQNGSPVAYTVSYANSDSTILITPASPLSHLTKYKVALSNNLQSSAGGKLAAGMDINFTTALDSSDKFPILTDTALVDLVQKQTFGYFWDFGHPTSGLSRERSNSDNNVVTSGGSGFGVMAILVGMERNFISRAQGLARMQTMVSFLKNTAKKVHLPIVFFAVVPV